MKTLTLRAWFGPNDYDIKPGFTPKDDDNLNTFRVGPLCVVFGIEDH
jgi:hypothetical protein